MKTFVDYTATTITPGVNHDLFVTESITVCDHQIPEFEQSLSTAKVAIGLLPHAPVKWNMRDPRIIQWYTENDSLKEYYAALPKTKTLREILIDELLEISPLPKIVCCVLSGFQTVKEIRIEQWCFNNTLQRLGFIQKTSPEPTHLVEIDWTGNNRKYFDEIYEKAWKSGHSATSQSEYYCGTLGSLGFERGPVYGNCLQRPGLQIIDILLGLYANFIKQAHDNPTCSKAYLVKKSLPLLRRSPEGTLWGYGFVTQNPLVPQIQGAYPWFD